MNETLKVEDYIKEPLQDNVMSLYNHIGRYYQAIKELNINSKDIVIDLACGQGYGTFLISKKANYVYGLDVNKKFIEFAKNNFQTKNNSFLLSSRLTEITYNKAICIETIEHLKESDMVEMLCKLSSAEQIYLTFPIGKNKPSSYNPYHKCEPSIDLVYEILKDSYGKIKIDVDEIKNDYGHNQNFCVMRGIK